MTRTNTSSAQKAGPMVGIPRALTFYKQAAMWVVFLESLGAQIIISNPTNKGILENGLKRSMDESCLPAKIFLGHVQDLINQKPDYIFVCRQQDFSAQEVLCTKLWGIPDICRNTFELPDGCNWLELNISPSIERITALRAWRKVGRTFTRNPLRIWAAFLRANRAQKSYEAWLRSGKHPLEALKLVRGNQINKKPEQPLVVEKDNKKIRIALLGHAYLIHDEHFGKPIIKLLKKLGAQVHIVEDLDKEVCRSMGREVSPGLYWTYNREIVGAAEYYLRDGVDGAIMVEAFPCGPDALALDLAMRKMRGRAPIMRLVLDELQALTGIQTRLESFLDVLQMRRKEVANG